MAEVLGLAGKRTGAVTGTKVTFLHSTDGLQRRNGNTHGTKAASPLSTPLTTSCGAVIAVGAMRDPTTAKSMLRTSV